MTTAAKSNPIIPATADQEPGHRALPRVLATVISAGFSLLLHGSVLAAALYWVENQPGAIETPTEAVTLQLLHTEVIEAVEAVASLEAAASPASVQSDPGETADSAASHAKPPSELRPIAPAEEIASREPPVETAPSAPEGAEAIEGTLEADEPAGAEQPGDTRHKKRAVKTAKRTEPSDTRKTENPARKKGAAQSRSTKGSAASKSRASASSGSSINYAAIVRARVASRKPAGGGRRGTVVIAFGVTRSGGVAFASISRSSGDPGLDRSVLSAVRGAGPFPAPPPGAGLRFAIPFYFR